MPTNRREYSEEYYKNNRARMRAQSAVNGKISRSRVRAYVQFYLSTHPCVDCGETDPLVLEFDHRDRVRKVFVISKAYGLKLKRVIDEIEKCDVRCANCHRRKTITQKEFEIMSKNYVEASDGFWSY